MIFVQNIVQPYRVCVHVYVFIGLSSESQMRHIEQCNICVSVRSMLSHEVASVYSTM